METTDCVIRELSPELLPDYLDFFDNRAFADNPQWGSCYCHCYYFPHELKSWKDATAAENRAAMIERITHDRARGHLAYVDGKVIGWCNAAPRPMLTALADEPDPQAEQIGEIPCFIIAKPYRRQGIATRLLDAACDGFRRQGLTIVEATARRDSEDDAKNYKGPLSMYLAAGFEVFQELDNGLSVVRKAL